jgi:cytochrome P450
VATWRAQVSDLIESYRQTGADRGDLMSRLLADRDEDDHGLPDTELADQVAVLMLAGGETTSAAVTWSWHLLTTHPEILAAVHTETDAVLGGDVARWDHLPHLDLTARVVREALRLYPPAWVLPRVCTRPVTLAGRTLPPAPWWSSAPTSCTAAPTSTPAQPASTPPAGSPRPPNTGPPTSPSAPAAPGASARTSPEPKPP